MRLAGALLLAAVVAGCGSATGSSLEDAAEATGAETSRIEMAYRVEPTETSKEYTFKSEGLIDYPGGQAVLTTSSLVPFFGEGVELRELRLLGDTGYSRWVVKGKSYWLKSPLGRSADPAELLIPGPGTPIKPTDVLTRVLAASEGSEVLGDEDLRGEETTHYRVRVNLDELVKQVPADERPAAELREQFGASVVPVDIWIDGDSRLRKLAMTRRKDPAVNVTVELYDYGVEVDVQSPTGELISQEELDELAGDSAPTLVPGEGEGEVLCEPRTCGEDKNQ